MQSAGAQPQISIAMEVEERAAPRFTLLIRAAKLVVEGREFLCVVRDVSATGARIRGFHPVPEGSRLALEFQTGKHYPADLAWQNGNEAGLQFHQPVNVDEILLGYGEYPRRDLRFNLGPNSSAYIGGLDERVDLINLSRQGCAIRSTMHFAIDQRLCVEIAGVPEIEARIRWRKDGLFGLVFDTTFSIGDLAAALMEMNSCDGGRVE